MNSSTAEKPEFQCPNCGYDLHGLGADADGVFRCPECGGLTTIMAIVDEHQRRRRAQWRMVGTLVVCIILAPMAMAMYSALRDPLVSTSAIEGLALLCGFGTFWLLSHRWEFASRWPRLGFAFVAMALVFASVHVPGGPFFGGLLLALWISGFEFWAIARV